MKKKNILFTFLISIISLFVIVDNKVAALTEDQTLYVIYYGYDTNGYPIEGVTFEVYNAMSCATKTSSDSTYRGEFTTDFSDGVSSTATVKGSDLTSTYVCIKTIDVPEGYAVPENYKKLIVNGTTESQVEITLAEFVSDDEEGEESSETANLKVVIKDKFSGKTLTGGSVTITDSDNETFIIDNGETEKVIAGELQFQLIDSNHPSGYKIINIADFDDYSIEAGDSETITLYAVKNYKFTVAYVNADTRDLMAVNYKLCNDKDCKSVIDQGQTIPDYATDDSNTDSKLFEIQQTSKNFTVFLVSELLDIQKERGYYFSKYTYDTSDVSSTSSIDNIQLDLEEEGLIIEIARSKKIVDYGIVYKLREDDSEIVGDVEYSIYPSCDSSTILTSDKSSFEIRKIHALEYNTVCLKTTKLPSGYNFYESKDSSVILTAENPNITIWLTSSSGGTQTPGDGDEGENPGTTPEVTTGNIIVKVTDKDGKSLSGAKYKLCKDSKCDDPTSDKTLESYNNLPLGTYYVKITSVPEGYVLPKDSYEVVLTKEDHNPVVPVKLDEKTPAPDTLLNVSKVFTACGIVGMLAGISLLYFNAKKKETA